MQKHTINFIRQVLFDSMMDAQTKIMTAKSLKREGKFEKYNIKSYQQYEEQCRAALFEVNVLDNHLLGPQDRERLKTPADLVNFLTETNPQLIELYNQWDQLYEQSAELSDKQLRESDELIQQVMDIFESIGFKGLWGCAQLQQVFRPNANEVEWKPFIVRISKR